MNEPLFIFDGYEKHILFKDDLEALTHLLNISYTIGQCLSYSGESEFTDHLDMILQERKQSKPGIEKIR